MSLAGKTIWVTGLLTVGISIALAVMGWQIFQISGQGILDTQFSGHSIESVTRILTAYQGNSSTEIYSRIQHLDMLYPAAYGLFGAVVLYQLFKPGLLRFLCLIPLFSAAFDFLENRLLGKIVERFPGVDPAMVERVSLYTQLKYGLIGVAVIALVIGLVRLKRNKVTPAQRAA